MGLPALSSKSPSIDHGPGDFSLAPGVLHHALDPIELSVTSVLALASRSNDLFV